MCLSKLFKHQCRFTKPIVSKYLSFNHRNIIYECKCGKRKNFIVGGANYNFPIATANLITNKEFNDILNGDEVDYYQRFQKPFA